MRLPVNPRHSGSGGTPGSFPPLHRRESPTLVGRRSLLLSLSGLVLACAGGPRPRPVTPAEIPALTTQQRSNPETPRSASVSPRPSWLPGAATAPSSWRPLPGCLAPAEALGPMVVAGVRRRTAVRSGVRHLQRVRQQIPAGSGRRSRRALAQLALRTHAMQTQSSPSRASRP